MGKHSFRINGHDYEVEINSVEGNVADVTVNGVAYKVELGDTAEQQASGIPPLQKPEHAAGPVQTIRPVAPAPHAVPSAAGAAKPAQDTGTVTAPLPGVIIAVNVKAGDSVKAGQTVAVLEAMKMENEIEAPSAGTVTAVHVAQGESVLEGASIITIG